MKDILTVTLNPALDIATYANNIVPGDKIRCEEPSVDPGGGGLNVSRAIKYLGGESRAFAALGGSVGLRLTGLLKQQGIDVIPFQTHFETRQSLAVIDRHDGGQYRFVLPGPAWDDALKNLAMQTLLDLLQSDGLVVFSGSQPRGVNAGFIGDFHRALDGRAARIVADVSGEPLHWLVNNPSSIDVLRMDAAEAADLSGGPHATASDTVNAAMRMLKSGVAKTIIIARGAEGSVLVDSDGAIQCRCDVTEIKSKVGAGDSFVGGYVLAVTRGADRVDALRHGVAAASAAVMTEGTELCKAEDVLRLLENTVVTEL